MNLDVLANDFDLDGDAFTIDALTQGSNGGVVNNGANLTYTPDSGFIGVDTFTYTIHDGHSGMDTATVSVIVTKPGNNLPVVTIFAPENSTPFTEGENISFNGTSVDAEDGDISGGMEWSSSIDGVLGTGANITALLSVGTHVITAHSTDAGYGASTASTVISVAPDVPLSPWIQSKEYEGVAWFLHARPNLIKRYDLVNRRFLHDIILPETPTAFAVDGGGLYVSFGSSTYRYDADGTSREHLLNTATDVTEIVIR